MRPISKSFRRRKNSDFFEFSDFQASIFRTFRRVPTILMADSGPRAKVALVKISWVKEVVHSAARSRGEGGGATPPAGPSTTFFREIMDIFGAYSQNCTGFSNLTSVFDERPSFCSSRALEAGSSEDFENSRGTSLPSQKF